MLRNNLKVLFVAAECAPFAKVGGLADVVGSLPKALFSSGVDARVILPFYGLIDAKKYKIKDLRINTTVKAGVRQEAVRLFSAHLPDSKVVIYFLKHPYFKNKKVYSGSDFKRFTFFAGRF